MVSVGAAARFNAPAGDVQAKVERLIARLRFELAHQDVRPDARALRDKLDLISEELTVIIAKQSEFGRGLTDAFMSDPERAAERAAWSPSPSDATASATSPDGHAVKSYKASGGNVENKLLPGRFTTPLQKLERRVAALESIALACGRYEKNGEVEHG